MSKELEYFQEIIKVDEEALTLANKEKNKKRDVMLHRHWLNQRKNIIEKALKEHEQYKAIEKELEMPIDKFFQALFGSAKMLKVWCIHPHKGLQEVFLSGFENHETARYFNAFNIDIGSTTLGLSQYGKTWAFTREELEK